LHYGLATGALFITIIALAEYTTGIHLPQRAGRPWIFGDALAATFNNPNNFAAHVPLMLASLFAVGVRKRATRAIVWPAMMLLAALSLLTYSRTSILSIALSAGILVAVTSGAKWSRMLPKLLIGAFLAASLWAVFGKTTDGFAEKLLSGSEESNQLRVGLASEAIRMIPESFGVGIGPGRFQDTLLHADFGLNGLSDVHNSIVEMAVAYGLIPALLLIHIIVRATRTHWRVACADPAAAAVGLGAVTSVVLGAFAASSVLGDSAWWLALEVAILTNAKDQVEAPSHGN